jgi:hypothetical protein
MWIIIATICSMNTADSCEPMILIHEPFNSKLECSQFLPLTIENPPPGTFFLKTKCTMIPGKETA